MCRSSYRTLNRAYFIRGGNEKTFRSAFGIYKCRRIGSFVWHFGCWRISRKTTSDQIDWSEFLKTLLHTKVLVFFGKWRRTCKSFQWAICEQLDRQYAIGCTGKIGSKETVNFERPWCKRGSSFGVLQSDFFRMFKKAVEERDSSWELCSTDSICIKLVVWIASKRSELFKLFCEGEVQWRVLQGVWKEFNRMCIWVIRTKGKVAVDGFREGMCQAKGRVFCEKYLVKWWMRLKWSSINWFYELDINFQDYLYWLIRYKFIAYTFSMSTT